MVSTVFVDRDPSTPIVAAWLNDVNAVVYGVTSPTTLPLGGVSIPDFSFDNTTSPGGGAGRVLYTTTNPAGWNIDVGRMTFDAEFICNNYFTLNSGGHFAIALRQDPALILTAARGQGVAIGNLAGATYSTDLNPSAIPETWFGLIGIGNLCYPNGEVGRSIGMQDGVGYRIIIDSTKANDGNRYLRYRMYYRGPSYNEWIQMVDTGDILDFNTFADLTQTALFIAHVFGANVGGWSVVFTNAKVTWGPAENATPDQTNKLSRYGAQLSGDLNFIGTSRTFRAPYSGGPSLLGMLTHQTSTPDSPTYEVLKPSGSATSASHVYSNDSTSSTTFQAVTVGIAGSEAQVLTYGVGAAVPNYSITIGIGNKVATFVPTGIQMFGTAIKNIGVAIGYSAGLLSWGGTNATTYSTTQNLDIDLACNIGQLATVFGATYSASSMETGIRPLWCLLSFLIKNLQDKKVI